MTIRNRTERSDRLAPLVSSLAVVGLTLTAAVHVAWAGGSTWPAANAEDFVELIMGTPSPENAGIGDPGVSVTNATAAVRPPGFPPPSASLAVAAALGTAAVLTAMAGGLIPSPGRSNRVARLGTKAAAGVLLARGTSGLAVSALELMPTTDLFRRWNLRAYSPLCLALGAAGLHAARQR